MIEEICKVRDWHVKELAYYKNIPHLYTIQSFKNIEPTYWKMCIPMIYSHWEGFVIYVLRELCDYINNQELSYSEVIDSIAILANSPKFLYLSGNCDGNKQKRFYMEFVNAYNLPIFIESNLSITANSNLNFKLLTKLFSYFDLDLPSKIKEKKDVIEKLVAYRNKIAHGENSIIVYEKDIINFVKEIIELFDLIILSINDYIENTLYKRMTLR